MKPQKFSLKHQYKLSWKYLKESSKFILIIVGIFLFFSLIGFFIYIPDNISNQILDYLKKIVEQTKDMNQLELTWFIFFNNLKASFFGLVLGVFFGIFSIIIILANGFILGFVANLSASKLGILSLWKIFPHGIFELPAVFISLGMGLRLGTFWFKPKKLNFFKENFWNSLRVFLYIVLPLLVIAAIIEGTLIFWLK